MLIVIYTVCFCVCPDAVAGSKHLVVPEHFPAVLNRAAVPLPLQDAGGEKRTVLCLWHIVVVHKILKVIFLKVHQIF